jgi:hypothetical protein
MNVNLLYRKLVTSFFSDTTTFFKNSSSLGGAKETSNKKIIDARKDFIGSSYKE